MCTDEEFRKLLDLLVATNDHAERDKAALALADCGRRECVPALITVMNDPRTVGHRGTLLYACSEYDCAEWVIEFVHLWVSSGADLDYEVLGVIAEMGSIERVRAQQALALIEVVRKDEGAQLRRRSEAARIMAHIQGRAT